MRLETATNNDCVAASLAMLLLDVDIVFIKDQLFPPVPEYPFQAPWDDVPRVPSMEEIVDWMWTKWNVAMVPFPYNPQCSPHPNCPGVPVWPNDEPDKIFAHQLSYGGGVIEGVVTETGKGHMVAWDGKVIYDPRGYIYSPNVVDKFGFQPTRFWLAVEAK
jgi:hypothetical protein